MASSTICGLSATASGVSSVQKRECHRFSDALGGHKLRQERRVQRAPSAARLTCQAVAAPERPTTTVAQGTAPRSQTNTVLAVILGGGAGSRLYPLTKSRAKPAVPIGGAYRLIDVPMSNCINSGVNKIYILTQFNSTSLNRHLARTYNFGAGGVRFGGEGFVEVLAATQVGGQESARAGGAPRAHGAPRWQRGQRYRMDYGRFVDHHRATGADITIGCLPMDERRASDFGLMKIDGSGRIVEFAEKPKGAALEAMKVDTTILGLDKEAAKKQQFIASMGIYVFKKDVMLKLLADDPSRNDFGGEIIPAAAEEFKVQAYLFNGYWEDIGTIESFFHANLALTQNPPNFEFHDPHGPIYTSPRFLPPAKIVSCKLTDAIVSHGAYLRECSVEHAIVGLRSRVGQNVTIKNAMIMGADYYESDEQRAQLRAAGKVPIGIGAGTRLENAIVDKNARISENVTIVNKEGVQDAAREEDGYYIRSGIVVVLRNATIPAGTVI
eukprot:scaffold2.g7300.t1